MNIDKDEVVLGVEDGKDLNGVITIFGKMASIYIENAVRTIIKEEHGAVVEETLYSTFTIEHDRRLNHVMGGAFYGIHGIVASLADDYNVKTKKEQTQKDTTTKPKKKHVVHCDAEPFKQPRIAVKKA